MESIEERERTYLTLHVKHGGEIASNFEHWKIIIYKYMHEEAGSVMHGERMHPILYRVFLLSYFSSYELSYGDLRERFEYFVFYSISILNTRARTHTLSLSRNKEREREREREI